MNVEIELKKLLENNGYISKKTKGGSIWTLHTGQRGSVVNFHNDGTVAFNFLSKHVRNAMKERERNVANLKFDEQITLFYNVISELPFYEKIKNHIPRPKLSQKNGIEYFSISSKVGIDVFREIVSFIVSGGCDILKQPNIQNNNYEYPLNEDEYRKEFESALRQIAKPEEKVLISDVEDQLEKNMAARGIALQPGWRKS